MKRVLLMICSVVLVLACIFGLFACVAGVRDMLNINEYKSADAKYARDNMKVAMEGIEQLKANEETYLNGVGTYTAGLSEYSAGQQAYNEGAAALEAGRQQVAAGQAEIDANTQAYNEGKELLGKIEPLMPYLNQYVELRDNGIGIIPGMKDWFGFSTAQAWFMSVVRPLGAQLGLDIPEDVTDFPAYMQQMVAEGQAKLKQYEDGLKALEAGKAQLAQGEKDLAAGANKLAAGAAQLAEGDRQLSVFEQGEITLAEGGMALCEGMQPCFSYYGGRQTIKSLPEYLAAEFGVAVPEDLIVVNDGVAAVNSEAYETLCNDVLASMYKVDENGNVVERRGFKMLDLDKCVTLCDLGEQYLVDQEADIKSEFYGRMGIYAAVAIASILGIIAGIIGLIAAINGGKKTGFGCGVVSAVFAVAALVVGLITKFNDYIYTIRVDEAGNYVGETAAKLDFTPVQQYTGNLQMTAVIILAAVTVLFVIFSALAKNAAKQKAAAAAAAAAEDEEAAYAAAALAAAEAAAEPAAEETVVEAPAAEAAPDEETVKE